MKQIYFLIVVLAGGVLSGCGGGGDRGELTGVPQRSFRAEVPYGMVYIPGGSFMMGQTDQDVTFAQTAQPKQVTQPPFFMDQTEITNSQYKQFVFWVRDSIAITNYVNDNKYYLQPKGRGANASGKKYINWAYVKKNPVWSNKKGQASNRSQIAGHVLSKRRPRV
jgi:sulfatase modifying factor 1